MPRLRVPALRSPRLRVPALRSRRLHVPSLRSPRPERRRRGDLLVAAAIVVAVLIAATVIWWRSDARGTTSVTADRSPTAQEAPVAVPGALTEVWRAQSAASRTPLVADGAVVTADDGTVTGIDPVSGERLWYYQRNMPLCAAESAWGTVVAAYRDRRGCSQVTELAGSDGARKAARTSQADDPITLHSDGTYVTAQGADRLEVWRSDLVRTLEYGYVQTPPAPNSQPRSGCALHSSASSGTRLAVIERCPREAGDRLTVLNLAPKDNQKPEEYGTAVLDGIDGARVLAASGDRIAVYLPGDGAARPPQLAVYGANAEFITGHPLSAPLGEHAVAARIGANILLWTGSAVVSLRGTDLSPAWSALDALGPGAQFAGRLLVPVPDGIAVLDQNTGQEQSRIPVSRDRSDPTQPIMSGVAGSVVLEQRGSELVALR